MQGNNFITVKNDKNYSIVMTVENLYNRTQKGEKFKIKSLVNGRFQFMPIAKVTYSGKKECIELYTDGDRIQHGILKHLSCTLDHPVYTENGFIEAGKLSVGDTIFANGKLVCEYCGKELKNTAWRKYNKYPNLCNNCSKHTRSKEYQTGAYEYKDKDGYIWVVDDTLRYIPEYRDYLKCKKQHIFYRRGILKHRLTMIQHLNRNLNENEIVHHIDGNKANNDISNLKIMTPSEHAKIHANVHKKHLAQYNEDIDMFTNKRGSKYYFTPHLVKITDIKPIGICDVYDIAIDDEDIHNFVCNDKVVHNTGKTVTSLSVADQLFNDNWIDNLIIICPVSKIDDWKRDTKNEVPQIKKVFVTSFQSAWREKANKAIHEQLSQHSLIIIDEGHKMKTYDSKQSKYIQTIVDETNCYVLVLSATPQNKKYIDLYPQYKVLGSKLFNVPAKEFKTNYCVETQNWNLVYAGKARFPFNEIIDYKHTDKMDKEVNYYTYYKKYESDYSRPIEIPQFFKMTSEMKYFKEKKVWPKMDEKELESILATDGELDTITDFVIANKPTLHHIYMRESCSGFIKDNVLKDNPKLQWLEDFFEGNEGRLVVFTNFINETTLISKLCAKSKRHFCIYDGSHKDLTNWEKYEDCVAIVNIVAGGTGINDLIKTNIAIYFSPPENYIDFEQSKGRIDRIGQTKQPVYYYLQIDYSVERAIYRTLKEKKNFDESMFENWLKGEEK